MSERWCGLGNHFMPLVRFRKSGTGRPARDCLACEKAREGREALNRMRVDGVDIDAIHRNPRFAKKAA